jgi:hypothetical protein
MQLPLLGRLKTGDYHRVGRPEPVTVRVQLRSDELLTLANALDKSRHSNT